MSKLEREIHIDASPEAVYDKLTDPDCLGEWVSVHDGIEEGPTGHVEKGDTLVQRMKVAGQKFRIKWHVDEASRPSRVVWTGKGPMGTKARATYEIRTNGGDGCTFSYVNEYDLLPRDDDARRIYGIRPHRFDRAVEHALREWEATEELAAR